MYPWPACYLIAALLCLTPCLAQDESAAATEAPAAAPLTVEQRLLLIEQKVDYLISLLGKPGGRTSFYDYLRREFEAIQKSQSDLEQEVRRLQSEIRRAR